MPLRVAWTRNAPLSVLFTFLQISAAYTQTRGPSQPTVMWEQQIETKAFTRGLLWDRTNIFGEAIGARPPSETQHHGGEGWTDTPAAGDPSEEPRAKGIQDNSFLIEEAYNQEPGVVQNIAVLRRQGRDWFFAFTQEFPVLGRQEHQFSYTLPYAFLRSDGPHANGIGDIQLNYRYQVLYENDVLPAFAPRFSLIFPTGNEKDGVGNGSFGFQTALPFSKIVSDRITLHANAGVTSLFDVHGRSPTSFNLGGSAIYAASRDFNLLLEVLGERNETVMADRRIGRSRALTVSPGFRYAFNFSGAQLVVGLAAPVTFTSREKPSYGAILYLSYESDLLR